jgi:hypothetical protein
MSQPAPPRRSLFLDPAVGHSVLIVGAVLVLTIDGLVSRAGESALVAVAPVLPVLLSGAVSLRFVGDLRRQPIRGRLYEIYLLVSWSIFGTLAWAATPPQSASTGRVLTVYIIAACVNAVVVWLGGTRLRHGGAQAS